MNNVTYLVFSTVTNFIQLYALLIIIRILLSWFQTQSWAANAVSFLAPVTDPYLNIFRSIIPPLGGIDFSAILALFVLNWIPGILRALIYTVA